jgi:multidrug efflux pump subunit AcrA (membrane-fusion protein)
VVTLIDYNSFYLELNMDERTISSIQKGQDVRISFEGTRNTLIKGKVRTVYASEGDFLVAVDADFQGLSLLPGMTCDVAVQIRTYQDQLLVPLGAISTGGDVVVVRQKHNITIPVVRGATDGQYALITSGELHEGDAVLIPKVASTRGVH